MLLKDHIVFLRAFSLTSSTSIFGHFSYYRFFTITNKAAKENIRQEVQSGGSLTQKDGDWVERSRSQPARADLVGRKVGDKYLSRPLLPPSDLRPVLLLVKGGAILCFRSAPAPGHNAEWPWMGKDEAQPC